jgi:Sulfotransferase domain
MERGGGEGVENAVAVAATVVEDRRSAAVVDGHAIVAVASGAGEPVGMKPEDHLGPKSQGYYDMRDRNLILLLGSPRSGTTWLAKILDSHRDVVFRHEPLGKIRSERWSNLMHQIQKGDGSFGQAERESFLEEMLLGHPDCIRPPFFAKQWQRLPHVFSMAVWTITQATNMGHEPLRRAFMPDRNSHYDFVFKQVDWMTHAENVVRALKPQLIIIIRHPCGVISSYLRGQGLGVMPQSNRNSWLDYNGTFCDRFGIDRQTILEIDDCEFLAVEWVCQNLVYLECMQMSEQSRIVVYERLCSNPITEVESLFEFLGWDVDKQTRRFLESSTRDNVWRNWLPRKSNYFKIKKDSMRVSATWRTELTAQQQEKVMGIVKLFPQLDRFWNADNTTHPIQGAILADSIDA